MRLFILCIFIFLICSFQSLAQSLSVTLLPYQIEGSYSYSEFEKKLLKSFNDLSLKKGDLVVLPELMSFDLLADESEDVKTQDKILEELKKTAAHFSSYHETLKKIASKRGLYIMGGSFHRLRGKNIYNTSIMVFPDGESVLQDKIFVTPWERRHGFKNGKRLQVFEIQGVKSVILNCHDVEFPTLSQMLQGQEIELFIVPSMTDDQYGHQRVQRTARARAIEHFAYVVHVGVTSSKKNKWHRYYGNSELYTPQIYSFAKLEKSSAKNQKKSMQVSLDFSLLREHRLNKETVFPIRDQIDRKEERVRLTD